MRKMQNGTHQSVNITDGLDVESEKKESKMNPKFLNNWVFGGDL